MGTRNYLIILPSVFYANSTAEKIAAQIPGAVSKIFVKKGDAVAAGEVLAVIEAMKMETSVLALEDGVIDDIRVSAGDSVKHGELLMTMKK